MVPPLLDFVICGKEVDYKQRKNSIVLERFSSYHNNDTLTTIATRRHMGNHLPV